MMQAALAHREKTNAGRWRAPSQVLSEDAALSPRNGDSAVDADRPVHPAELAQAQAFRVLLEAEFVSLTNRANRIAGPLDWLKRPEVDLGPKRRELSNIHARIDEICRLLKALQVRFPHAPANR